MLFLILKFITGIENQLQLKYKFTAFLINKIKYEFKKTYLTQIERHKSNKKNSLNVNADFLTEDIWAIKSRSQ